MTNVLLHGFWGQPRDWNKVLARLELSTAALTPDLYASGGLSPEHELGGPWEENFHGYLDMEAGAEPVNLIGYSMGARLALGAYFFKPERFSRVLLLSGNPVIPEEDRAARAEWERLWREKFLTQPWSELESGWQEIPVFSGDEPVKRQRAEPLRAMLGLSLSNWSPRRHGFGWERVRELPKTVDWAFGALDQKYLEVAKTLRELPVPGQIAIIPNAGHRLPAFADQYIAHWIEKRSLHE